MDGIYLLLGSNVSDRLVNLRKADALLRATNLNILENSSVYETEPWGKHDQSWFLNVILQIETPLTPIELLEQCLGTEAEMGRKRVGKWGARLIDIDILYYHHKVIQQEKLIIPHPGIPDRMFTLIPLCELCPDEIHPVLNQTQAELLLACGDPLNCALTEHQL